MKASKSKSTDADSRLEEAALLLEEMARDLRRLKKRNGETKVPAGVSSASDAEGVQVGSRVRVTRKDQYRGRTGVVLRRHGRLFWDVRLEASEAQGECLIFKKESSLRVVGPG